MKLTDPSLSEPEQGSRLHMLCRSWSKYLAVSVITIAILVLIGWQWGIIYLKQPVPHLAPMAPLTVLAFLLAAASTLTFLKSSVPGKTGSPLLSRLSGGLVLLTGLLKIAGLVAHLPGQMTAQTGYCFVFAGLALLVMDRETKDGRIPAQYFALIVATMGFFSVLGYLYRVRPIVGVFTYTPMSVYTGLCFCFLSIVILLAHPDKGIMKELTSSNMGGLTARSLLPLIILLPVILGYLRLMAYWKGLITTEFGVDILVSAILLAFVVIVWFNARLLNHRDEQKNTAERHLMESEERFRLLVSSVKDYAIFMLDPSGYVISWNEGAERIKGYKKDEIIGRHMSVFYTPEEIQRGEPGYNLEQARGNDRFEQEGWRLRKDGSIFWANVVFTAVRDAQGNILGYAKVTRDITERKKSTEQIAYMARLMEDTSDAIFSTDPSFIIRTWNKAAEMLFRYTPEEAIGKTAGNLLKIDLGEEVIHAIRRELVESSYWKGEVYYKNKNGGNLTVLLSASAVRNPEGAVEGFVMVCRDFTERKKLELQLHQFNKELESQVAKKTAELTDYKYALDQSSIVSITDEKGVIKYVNDNFCRISQFTEDELIGQHHHIIGSQYHPDMFFNDMWKTITKGKVWKGEIRNKAKDGSIYWVDMTIIPFLNERDEPFEYIALDNDISERKKAEALLDQYYQDIRQLASHLQDVREEERAGIAREIHDELGQQLTGLKMDLSWINKRPLVQDDDELRQKVVTIMNLLDTTIKTVRRIATDLRPSILDDLGLIAAIEWQSQEFGNRSGISTEFNTTMDEFKYAPAIAVGMFRICQESLTNVARHADASKIRISLEEENEKILLTIRDNGKGFDSWKIGGKKTLGLLGMKERTLMMGGEFRIESLPGKGTTLMVTVPITATNTNP